MEYKKLMNLVELYVLRKTRYDKHNHSGWKLNWMQHKFAPVKSNINEAEVITDLRPEYSVSKLAKN